VLIACVPWETLPLRLVRSDDSADLRLVLVLLAMIMTLAAGLLVRRTLAIKIWQAGDLSAPVFAQIQWVTNLVSTELVFLAVAIALAGTRKERFTSGMYIYERTVVPTPNGGLVALGLIGLVITAVIGFVALIAATINQHLGIRDDKRLVAEAVARGYARARR
jgi:hypothetical protein